MRARVLLAAAVVVMAGIAFATWGARRCSASLHAIGTVGVARVDTTVDSAEARYLIEEYFAGRRRQPRVDRRIDALRSSNLTTTKNAAVVAQRFSTDVSALLVAAQLMEENKAVQAIYERHLVSPSLPLAERARGMTVLFVPGWLYLRHPETGASLEREITTLRRAGVDARRIGTDENGSVEENARVIAAAIHDARAERLLLVSASKGGPEVMLALDSLLDPKDLPRIAAWVNVGGILGGTPLADQSLTVPRRWLTGILLLRHCEGVASMTSVNASRRRKRVPTNIVVINFIAVPLSGDVTARARDGYCALRPYGPNDGLTLITEAIVPGAATITSLGSDHFFQKIPPEKRAIALLETVLDLEADKKIHQATGENLRENGSVRYPEEPLLRERAESSSMRIARDTVPPRVAQQGDGRARCMGQNRSAPHAISTDHLAVALAVLDGAETFPAASYAFT